VWTKDAFYVARPNETNILDSIPLHEINDVMEMSDDPDATKFQQMRSKQNVYSRTDTERKDGPDGTRDIMHPTIFNDSSFFSSKSSAKCVFQIKTALDGVVAGRTLFFSTRTETDPEQQRQAIVSTLKDAVATAHRKALVMSRFQKAQEAVRWIQGSLVFQIFMAILIMMVLNFPSFSSIYRKQNCHIFRIENESVRTATARRRKKCPFFPI
jgi:hypothetical protein